MAVKSMAYDHPAYIVPQMVGGSLDGNGASDRFAAAVNCIVKSWSLQPCVAGTSNDTVTAYQVSGTASTTHVLATFGSAASAGTNVLGTFTLAKNDGIVLVKGTDATGDIAWGAELVPVPGADVTD